MRIGIIFDIDGTLWDSSAQVAAAWSEVFAKYSQVHSTCDREDFLKLMGQPMTAFGEYFLPEMTLEERAPILKECEEYENEYLAAHPPKAFEGVAEVLKQLSEKYPLFIVSNCQQGYIETFMDVCGLRSYIRDWRSFGDTQLPKDGNIRLIADKHHLERFFYVGDIEADYIATKNAHGEFVYAAYGFGNVNDDVPRIGDIREFPECLKRILSGE